MISIYKSLFSKTRGAALFSLFAFIGRLSPAMIALSILLPLSDQLKSYAKAGLVVGFTLAGVAVLGQYRGRLLDRHGQRPILLTFAALNLIFISLFIFCLHQHSSIEILCAVGILLGMTQLSLGSIVRTRWSHVLKPLDDEARTKAMHTAFAFEAIVDEVVYMSAPVLATFLCISVSPVAGLVCCALTFISGSVLLALQSPLRPVHHVHNTLDKSVITKASLMTVAIAIFFIGFGAGSLEVIITARANAFGMKELTGLLMAVLALSSMLGGLWYGGKSFKVPLKSVWVRCIFLLTLALVPFFFSNNLITVAISLFIAGLIIGPTSITGQMLVEKIVPAERLNEAFNIVGTAMVIGMALGSWLSGYTIDKIGAFAAGALPAVATFFSLAVALNVKKLSLDI